jgi:hypothetical protein
MTNRQSIRHASFEHSSFLFMSGPAQVRSSDAIEAFSLALAKFADRVQTSLDSLDVDLRRSDSWIDHDRPSHWKRQVQDAQDALHEAKQELEHCLLVTSVDGQRPSCREQKAAVTHAKARLDYCRDKLEVVKKWQRTFTHDVMEFRGRLGQLRRALEQDVPQARAVLRKVIEHIEMYQLERVPVAADMHAAPPGTPLESFTRIVPPAPTPVAPTASAEATHDHE